MATILYKDGVKNRVEADQVQKKLAAGYSVTDEPVEYVKVIEPVEPVVSVEAVEHIKPVAINVVEASQPIKTAGKRGRKRAQN